MDDYCKIIRGEVECGGELHELENKKAAWCEDCLALHVADSVHGVERALAAMDVFKERTDQTAEAGYEAYSSILEFVYTALKEKPKPHLRCSKCEGIDVQYVEWYAPNIDEVQHDAFCGTWQSAANTGQSFCNGCQDHTELEDIPAEES